MELYLKSGYLNFNEIVVNTEIYTFIVGARGIGKTYGMIKWLLDNNISFLYLRRTKTQLELLNSKDENMNPFTALNNDTSYSLSMKKINPQVLGIYNSYPDPTCDGEMMLESLPRGYGMALSTFANMRSFGSDIDFIFYDEFIPEKHAKPIREEATAFFNLIESISRNRELKGEPPIKVICCANSDDVGCPIFMALNVVNKALEMQEKGIEEWHDHKRHLSLIMPTGSSIAKAKQQTSLYQLTKGSGFYSMATENAFVYNDLTNIRSVSLKDYRPVCFVGEIAVYRNKGAARYYVTAHRSGAADEYLATDMDLKRWRRDCYNLWLAYLKNNILFEDYKCKVLFEKYSEVR